MRCALLFAALLALTPAAPGAAWVAGRIPSPDRPCKTLLGAGREERWYFLEYRVDSAGQVRELVVQFASDPGLAADVRELGQLVLEHIEEGLEVVSRGDNAGPFSDVFLLTFQDGETVVFSQSHHVVKSGEPA